MDAKKLFKKNKLIVDEKLKKYFDSQINKEEKISLFNKATLLELKRITLSGGKRFRASLVYYSYLLLRGRNEKAIIDVSIFIELVHTYLLIHDDIIDQSETRRSSRTVHSSASSFHKRHLKKKNASHFGNSIAICLGDLLSHMGTKLLAEAKFKPENRIRALTALNEHIIQVVYGEIHDVVLEYLEDATEEDILNMLNWKTAKYTFEIPLHVGAILAGGTDKDLKILTEYSVSAGVAFQIQDDILGLFGDEKKLGEPVDSDLKEGKKTLLIHKALEKGTKKEQKVINSALGNSRLTKKQLKEVREIVVKTGSLKYSQDLAKKLAGKAKKSLKKGKGWKKEPKEFLEGVVDYMVEREV